jgi:hypothetical protein
MFMGWYEDRPDNVNRGIWILGTGAAIAVLLVVLGRLGYTIPETNFSTTLPSLEGAKSLGDFKSDLTNAGVKIGAVSQFGVYLIYVLMAVMNSIAKLTGYVINLVGSAFLAASKTGETNVYGVSLTMLSSIAYGLYVYFAMHEISSQYKRISNMGGSDLSSFGIPIQLILRLALPLIFLSSVNLFLGLGANIAGTSISKISNTGMNLYDPLKLATEMGKSLQGMNFFSELIFTALCALNFFMGMFSMGKIAAIGISIGIRLVGYGVALPVGIASFASEDYQDIGKGMIKGFLGSALQGAFVIMSITLTLTLASKLLEVLLANSFSFSNIQIAVAIVSAGILAAAEEGFNLSKELIR